MRGVRRPADLESVPSTESLEVIVEGLDISYDEDGF